MRQLGTLPERAQAERLADYLTAQEMLASVEPSGKAWAVWIRDEDHIDPAKAVWDEFQQHPDDPKFVGHRERAAAILREREEKAEQARAHTRSASELWQRPAFERLPVTIGLIVISVGVSIFSQFGQPQEIPNPPSWQFSAVTRWVAFYDPHRVEVQAGLTSPWVDVREGQVWRLLTPIFLHFSVMHLLFNMIWLYRLGSVLEHRRGTWWLLLFVLATGVVSNVAQEVFGELGLGGGFSGVVYAMFGYAWVYTIVYREVGFELDQGTVIIMFLWLVVGFTGYLDGIAGGAIANWAHLGGLLSGMAFAYLPHLLRRR